MNKNLLSPNQTALEKQLSFELSQIFKLNIPITPLWHAEHCPTALLPWLAWTLSVDEWDDDWSKEQKRNTILQSARLHKQKGTVASIRRVAEIARDYLDKGSKVYIEGKLKTRKWTDNKGVERYLTEIIAGSLQMLSSRNGQQPTNTAAENQQPEQPQYNDAPW
ncbi:hypothetical protein A1D23_05220 [Chelonobacter oris]|uniref:phage tail protein I n=1 Tax=Chelonobacter oris TaxID=505317 RepID=UPI002446A6DD|nr:phage tail protein I [Chelonobacter oris]MDH2999494.1 hypothetical protein [Chelonobacter oris]